MPDLVPLARHGLIARSDALAGGISQRAWRTLHEQGRLEPMLPGVSRIVDPERAPTREQAILAAVLSAGSSALASHRSAAYLWGLATGFDLVEVTVPRSQRLRPRLGVIVHRTLDQADTAPSTRSGIPVTSPLRTLVDLGAVAPMLVEPFLVHLTCTGLVTIPGVRAVVDRHTRQGRIGVGQLRAVLESWPLGESTPDSVLEVDLARLLDRYHLDGFVHHAVIEGYEVDFARSAGRLILEADGYEFHSSREAFEADRIRDARLVAAGWRVLRLTWARIHGHPDWIADIVRRAIVVR